jgi:hypothetical protein
VTVFAARIKWLSTMKLIVEIGFPRTFASSPDVYHRGFPMSTSRYKVASVTTKAL